MTITAVMSAASSTAVLAGLLAGLLGAVAASFCALVAARLPAGLSLAEPSHCDSCQRRLRPLELVPVASWLLLRGRCRSCRAAVPARYVLAEVACAAVWAALGCLLPGGAVLAAALLATWLVLLALLVGIEHSTGVLVRSRPPAQLLVAVLPAAGVVALLQSLLAQLHVQLGLALAWALPGIGALLLGALLSTRPTEPARSNQSTRSTLRSFHR
ncbi:prepilin peptidase [Kineococcus sp. SYSU DK005]|uniref:prepilin peptidase n=1 Tax=Kineococcus sp. SYSU DK005 TaxID=3383126 RepID=UPI003D7D0DD0